MSEVGVLYIDPYPTPRAVAGQVVAHEDGTLEICASFMAKEGTGKPMFVVPALSMPRINGTFTVNVFATGPFLFEAIPQGDY